MASLAKLCECGCGELVNVYRGKSNRFVGKHHRRGAVASKVTRRKMSEAHKDYITSDITKSRISRALRGHVISEETRQKLSKFHTANPNMGRLGTFNSVETREKISKANKGKVQTAESKEKKRQALCGVPKSEEHRHNMKLSAQERWKDPTFREKSIRRLLKGNRNRPNKIERKLQRFLDNRFPGEWKYVGDGSFIIAGKNPDFINVNGKKQIIELFGDYWHKGEDPADRAKVFEPYGFKTLVVWQSEMKNMLAVGVMVGEFINGQCEKVKMPWPSGFLLCIFTPMI